MNLIALVLAIGLQFLTLHVAISRSDITDDQTPVLVTAASSAKPQCAQATTLTFCLDDSTYPSDDIQREINSNYGTFYKMYADVANQSTSSLVEGVPGDLESKYDYAYYYGDKRNLLSAGASKDRPVYSNYGFRDDYYKDQGGYICPAFIDYTSLYQATNARGEWQYIVNVKPWTQTVRLEQCFYPMAPCSYISPTFKSQCAQKYSYQRLIAYEPQGRGLYTDVFRLPTACSCYLRPLRSQFIPSGAMMSDASQNIGSSYAYQTFNIPPQPGNAYKPPRARSPPRPANSYTPAASQNDGTWFPSPPGAGASASDMSANVEMMASSQNTDSRLVERRRLRPEGLSLGDITSDPEVDPSDYTFDGPRPGRRPPSGPPRYVPQQGAPSFSGDESRLDPNYAPAGSSRSDQSNNGMNNQQQQQQQQPGGMGPRMWTDGSPDSGLPGNAQSDYRLSQGPGFYDYNSAQHN